MKNKLIVICVLSIATQLAFASMPPKPEKCPSVSALRNTRFDKVVQHVYDHHWEAVARNSNYDTKERWLFAVNLGQASTEYEARRKIKPALESLQFVEGPKPVTWLNVWACVYRTNIGPAITNTPEDGEDN